MGWEWRLGIEGSNINEHINASKKGRGILLAAKRRSTTHDTMTAKPERIFSYIRQDHPQADSVAKPGICAAGHILLLIWTCLLTMQFRAWAGPVYEPVAAFDTGPILPGSGNLLLHSDGNLYGTALGEGFGTIYKTTLSGDINVLVRFTGTSGPAKGRKPDAGVVSDSSGALWGTTSAGGAADLGTVFKVDLNTGALTTLVEFNGTNGSTPEAELVSDGNGFFWGTTYTGGALDNGTIFKINTHTGTFTTFAEFTGTSGALKGSAPFAALVNDGNGYLWGATTAGGGANCGTIFKINSSTGAFTTVTELIGTSAALVSDGNGFFWGTTFSGGANNSGTIFKIDANTGAVTTVFEFDNTNGGGPRGKLLSDGNGSFWGTTSNSFNPGTVFKYNIATGILTVPIVFGIFSGQAPLSGLISDGNGSFWGTTSTGFYISGSIFKLNAQTGALTAEFPLRPKPNGDNPAAGLVSDGNGFLWGTGNPYSQARNEPYGTAFKVNPSTGALVGVVKFAYPNTADGLFPGAPLYNDGNGFLWGTTSQGGDPSLGYGTVFKLEASTGVLTTLVKFTGTSGAAKGRSGGGPLLDGGDGFLWGTTSAGGAGDFGTVYKIDPHTGAFMTVVEFSGKTGNAKGSSPGIFYSDGNGWLWGTTGGGGAQNMGTIFKLSANTAALTTLIEFTGTSGLAKGSSPTGALVDDGNGFLWGTTFQGGAANVGTIFKLNTSTSALTTIAEFTGASGPISGYYPQCNLVNDGHGTLWGMTYGSGGDYGSIFTITTNGVFSNVLSFTGTSGNVPGARPRAGGLLRYADGNFYGATSDNELSGAYGRIFRLRFGPTPATQPATPITATSATLRGTINPNGQVTAASFQYGTDPALSGAVTANLGNSTSGNAPEAFAFGLTNLIPQTTYFYRIVGTNPENPIAQQGAILSFTTPPNTAPVVTLAGANPLIFEAAATYTDPGASAMDAEDGILNPSATTSNVIANKPGDYSVTWSATDNLGASGSATRIVHVVDTTPPAITLQGANPAWVIVGTTYQDAGATANDIVDGTLSTTTSGAVNTNTTGIYVLTYSATDTSGNTATPQNRTVHVVSLLDYALGLESASGNNLPQLATAGGKLTLTFTHNTAVSDVRLAIQGANSVDGPWIDLASSESGAPFSSLVDNVTVSESGNGTVRVQASDFVSIGDPAHPSRFLRLKIEH